MRIGVVGLDLGGFAVLSSRTITARKEIWVVVQFDSEGITSAGKDFSHSLEMTNK